MGWAALPPENASGTAPSGPAAPPASGCRSPESSCLWRRKALNKAEPTPRRHGAEGRDPGAEERRGVPTPEAQGLRMGPQERTEQRHSPAGPSFLTCDAVNQHLPLMQLLLQLADLSLLAPVSHGQFWGEGGSKEGHSAANSTLYWSSVLA